MRVRAGIAALALTALFAGCGATAPNRVPTPRADARERLTRNRFAWPLTGTVSSPFGDRAGGRHEGVDILAPEGTVVRAAGAGVAAYAGNGMRGYGKAVILDHGNGVTTLYGHLRSVRVESAEVVPKGAVIGTVGRTGNATNYHLHFELRIDGEAVDPVAYLAR